MKKRHLIILAAAAMTACTNQEVLTDALSHNNSAQSAIGFSSFSEKATKGINDLEYFHDSFVVYGTKQHTLNPSIIGYIFGGKALKADTLDGTICRYMDASLDANLGQWRYDPPRWWERQSKYYFVAYAPASENNPLRFYYHAANSLVGDPLNKIITSTPYILQGTNLQSPTTLHEKTQGFTVQTDGDLDLMVSDTIRELGSNHDSYHGTNNYVSFVFRHILSKLNVTIDKTEAVDLSTVTVNEISIQGLKDRGDYDASRWVNNTDTMISGWTASYSTTPSTYTISFTGSQDLNKGNKNNNVYTKGAPIYFIESLVMPQEITAPNQVTMSISYTITGTKEGSEPEPFYDVIDFYNIQEFDRQFFDGYNYTLKLTIGPDLIMLDSKVSNWANLEAEERTGD
ncbi:MAG: fimbrillin family protein [Bacteroidaceae bacterium]|nr:fimbrillin family protein [Bacteroidaceae bacterium]